MSTDNISIQQRIANIMAKNGDQKSIDHVNEYNELMNIWEECKNAYKKRGKSCKNAQDMQNLWNSQEAENLRYVEFIVDKSSSLNQKKNVNQMVYIDEGAKQEGNKLAEELIKELDSKITSNRNVKEILSKINDKNAYNFLLTLMVNNKKSFNGEIHHNVSDIWNVLDNSDTCAVMEALWQQACQSGLYDNQKVQELRGCINEASNKNDPTKSQTEKYDRVIKSVLMEMSTKAVAKPTNFW